MIAAVCIGPADHGLMRLSTGCSEVLIFIEILFRLEHGNYETYMHFCAVRYDRGPSSFGPSVVRLRMYYQRIKAKTPP